MVLSGNGFQTQQSPHGGMNLVRAIFVGLFDLLQPNIRAGVDFRWVIIALIGGEEVVERLRGIRCGAKPTSCPDQLARALEEEGFTPEDK